MDDAVTDKRLELTGDEFVRLYEDHSLVEKISSWIAGAPLLDLAVDMHNAKRLDLLSIVDWPKWQTIEGPQFFQVSHFLGEAIPRLEADVNRLMAFVSVLVAKGGDDVVANQPNGAFTRWCERHPDQAKEIVGKAIAGDQLATDHLSFALQALNDLHCARSVVLESSGLLRLAALTGLARIPHKSEIDRDATIAVLTTVMAPDANDLLRATIFEAAVNTYVSTASIPTDAGLCLLKNAVRDMGGTTLHSAARALTVGRTLLTKDITVVLLDALESIDPTHKRTISLIDVGLVNLLKVGLGDQAVAFLLKLLTQQKDGLSLHEFGAFCDELLSNHPTFFSRFIIRSLLSGISKLCQDLDCMFSKTLHGDYPLTLNFGQEKLLPTEVYFICRKAIGYFFIRPAAAASVLVAALRELADEWADLVQELLFDPLLLNYGGSINAYLATIDESDPAYQRVRQALDRQDSYLKGLESPGQIRELRPSQNQRQLEYSRFADEMHETMRAAHTQSIFYDLVKRSTLLYGNRSTFFTKDQDGRYQRHEMELQSHEYKQEWPRAQITDPVGLETVLFAFRAEQQRK